MSADLISNFIGMTLQTTGNNNNAWGAILNGSALVTLERAIAGNIVRAVTGGTLDLSGSPPPAAVSQVLDFVQIFQGILTANQIVIVPNLSRYWKFLNETTGAFQLLLQTPSGAFINVPQGCSRGVTCDGNGNLLRDDRDQVGNFEHNTQANAGTLNCNGASVLKTDFPDLFLNIGTTYGSADSLHFTLPLLTDTGRYLRSATGSVAAGTYQSNQNFAHTHTVTGAPSAGSLGTDSQGAHQHGVYIFDPGHHHTSQKGQPLVSYGGGGGVALDANVPDTTSTNTTSITIGSVSGVANDNLTALAGAHIHNITGAPGVGSLGTASQGGSEARPESLVVTTTIRY